MGLQRVPAFRLLWQSGNFSVANWCAPKYAISRRNSNIFLYVVYIPAHCHCELADQIKSTLPITCCVCHLPVALKIGLSQFHSTCHTLRAHYTSTPRPPLAAVSGAHRFQVSRACLSMSIHGLVLHYLSDYFQRVAFSNRRRLRSSSSLLLLIRRTRLITVGDRAFPVAGSRLWNSLPHVVTSAATLAVFRKRLKTYLFSRSYAL